MKKQRLVIILLGLLLAAGSSAGLYRLIGELEKKEPVLVIKKTVEPQVEFTGDAVEIVMIPPRYILSGAISDPEAVLGKRAGVKMFPGEQVLRQKLVLDTAKLEDNQRYLYVASKNVTMKPGQKVDVYFIYTPGKSNYSGVEKILEGKLIANVLDERGYRILYGHSNTAESGRSQAGLELIVSTEEILNYLSKLSFAKETIVRYGEG